MSQMSDSSEKSFVPDSLHEKSKSPAEENMQIFCKQMLKTRIFLGAYQERRYVDQLKTYKDLVLIDSKTELEIIKDLNIVKNRIRNFYRDETLWMGITDPDMIGAPAVHCIWTELEDLPFGSYWFQIKTVRFKPKEILIKLKLIRSMRNNDNKNMNPIGEEIKNNSMNRQEINFDTIQEAAIALLASIKNLFLEFIMAILTVKWNRQNFINFVKFVSLLLISLFTFSIQFIKYMGLFTIRFLEEFRKLIHIATPIFLGVIDMLTKIVGGFYLLLAMIWRDSINSKRPATAPIQKALPPIPPNWNAQQGRPRLRYSFETR